MGLPRYTRFTTTKTIGAKLRKMRLQLHLTLDDVSLRTLITKRNLMYIEHEEFEKVAEEVYVIQYLKTYSTYLGIQWDEIRQEYAREKQAYFSSTKKKKRSHQPSAWQFWVPSRILKNAMVVLVLFCSLGYLGYLGVIAVQPPDLVVYNPRDNSSSTETKVVVEGKTAPDAQLMINGQRIIKDQDGTFNQEVSLTEGVNLIKISAAKKYSKEYVVYRKIMVEDKGTISLRKNDSGI